MNLIKRLISNLKSKQYSTLKLKERYLLSDYKYLKRAFENSANYLKVQAVEYLSNFNDQNNFDYLIEQFKSIEDLKLKSYTYQSILKITQNSKLKITDSDKLLLKHNRKLLKNIGDINQIEDKKKSSSPIVFRDKNKDLLKDLEDKKRLNENMSGF